MGESRDDVFLTFEYCEHDMSTLLQSFRTRSSSSSSSSSSLLSSTYQCKFGEGGIKRLMLGLLSGLNHLHERLIVSLITLSFLFLNTIVLIVNDIDNRH